MTTAEPQAAPTEEDKLNDLRRERAELGKQEERIKRGLFEKHATITCSNCGERNRLKFPEDYNYRDGNLRRVLRVRVEDHVVGTIEDGQA